MNRRNILKLGTLSALFPFVPVMGKGNSCDPTTTDIQGPFYTPNAPVRTKISPEGAEGTVLFLTGTVYHNDCETPIPMANLDVWQADHGGAYDNVGFDFRGKFNTDEMGVYAMETILPGKYLNGAAYRPRHIHLKAGSSNNVLLTTQLYFEGDSDIPADPWASDETAEGRIIPLTEDANGHLHGVFDISLNLMPVIDSNTNISPTSGTRIISINPNPIASHGQIRINNSKKANLDLSVFSIDGRMIKNIHHSNKPEGIHTFDFDNLSKEGIKLNPGIYIIQLKMNREIIDAKRFMLL